MALSPKVALPSRASTVNRAIVQLRIKAHGTGSGRALPRACVAQAQLIPIHPTISRAAPGAERGGGEGGIRTLGTLASSTVFETAPIDHSGTSPQARWARNRHPVG